MRRDLHSLAPVESPSRRVAPPPQIEQYWGDLGVLSLAGDPLPETAEYALNTRLVKGLSELVRRNLQAPINYYKYDNLRW